MVPLTIFQRLSSDGSGGGAKLIRVPPVCKSLYRCSIRLIYGWPVIVVTARDFGAASSHISADYSRQVNAIGRPRRELSAVAVLQNLSHSAFVLHISGWFQPECDLFRGQPWFTRLSRFQRRSCCVSRDSRKTDGEDGRGRDTVRSRGVWRDCAHGLSGL